MDEVMDENTRDTLRGEWLFYILVFVGILLIFAGLDLMIMLSKLSRLSGIPVFIGGVLLLVAAMKRYGTIHVLPEFLETGEGGDVEQTGFKSAPIIYWTTAKEKLIPYVWIVGGAIILLDIGFNIFFDAKFADDVISGFGSFDISVVMLGAAFIAYRFIPLRFSRERDFILVLGVFLFLILVFPVTLASFFSEESFGIANSPIVYNLLTKPMIGLVKLFGIDAYSKGNEVFYELQSGGYGRVLIATSCAGIYSQSLFISGFVSYILVEYRRWDIKASLMLVAGVLTAWFANVLRMSIIVVIGSYKGEEAFLWAHKYLGTLIFFVWIFVFWGLIFFVLKVRSKKSPSN